jgi:tetratricopeptide (TPR) repeat protein
VRGRRRLRARALRGAVMGGALGLVGLLTVAGCGEAKSPGVVAAKTVESGYAPDRLLEIGRVHRKSGDTTRAEQEFAAVLENKRASEEQRRAALRELMATCIEAQRFRVAIDYAEPELRRHPNDVALLRLVASLAAAVGEGLKARDLYERLLALAPSDAESELALARVMRDAFADRLGAGEHFERYVQLAPNGPHAGEARAFLQELRP